MLLVFTAPFFQGVLSLENKPSPCVLYSMHLCRTVHVVPHCVCGFIYNISIKEEYEKIILRRI